MKKISISLMSFVFAIQCIAQTNTFPSSGNVGIGVSSPTCKLDVDGSVRTTGAIRSSDGFYFIKNGSNSFAGGGYFQLSNSAGTDGYLLQNNASNGLDFWSTVSGTNSNRMTLASNGNVGIGTGSPMAKLDVNGSGNFSGTIRVTDGYYLLKNGSNSIGAGGYFQLSNAAGTDGYLLQNNATNGLDFWSTVSGVNSVKMRLGTDGNLSVNGNVTTKKIVVTHTGWSDYVFKENYKLRSLTSLEKYIIQNKHLPEMPSAKEVEEKGISVGDNQALLLKKIEELTLYLLQMNKTNLAMKKEIKILKQSLKK